MLRGTVYLVFDPEAEPLQRIERSIVVLDVETIAEFRQQAHQVVTAPIGSVIDFGPIGPPWGMATISYL